MCPGDTRYRSLVLGFSATGACRGTISDVTARPTRVLPEPGSPRGRGLISESLPAGGCAGVRGAGEPQA